MATATDSTGDFQILKPASWPRPSGYSNGIAVSGRQIFVAGQIGWDSQCKFNSTKLADHVRQALKNICAGLGEVHAGPEHIGRLPCFLTSRDEYVNDLENVGAAYREVMGKN